MKMAIEIILQAAVLLFMATLLVALCAGFTPQ